MSMYYGTETNNYAKNKVASPSTTYIRGRYLDHIDYGQRSDSMFSAQAPMQVVFNAQERCIGDATYCDATKYAANHSHWPDTPYDQYCASGATCTDKNAPTF